MFTFNIVLLWCYIVVTNATFNFRLCDIQLSIMRHSTFDYATFNFRLCNIQLSVMRHNNATFNFWSCDIQLLVMRYSTFGYATFNFWLCDIQLSTLNFTLEWVDLWDRKPLNEQAVGSRKWNHRLVMAESKEGNELQQNAKAVLRRAAASLLTIANEG